MSEMPKLPACVLQGVTPLKFQWQSPYFTSQINSDQFGGKIKWMMKFIEQTNLTMDVYLECLSHDVLMVVQFNGQFTLNSEYSVNIKDSCSAVGLIDSKAPLKVASGLSGYFNPGCYSTVVADVELQARVFENSCSCSPALYTDLTSNFTDCKIVVGAVNPVTLPAHRAILAARSSVFAAMFYGSVCKEQTDGVVAVTDLTASAMRCLLNFIYTGLCGGDVLTKEAVDIFKAADKYNVQELRKFCAVSLNSNLNSANAAAILFLAETHCVPEMKDCATKFIVENFVECEKTDDWKSIEENMSKLAFSIVKTRALRQTT